MAQPQIKIVHESEAQRQHVRLQIPCRVEIEGQSYRVSDLSSGGLSVEGYTKTKQLGQALPIILAMPFDDFTLDLALKVEIQHQNASGQTVGCRFTDLSTSQLSVLNYVIKAFVAGDLLSAGDVLAVTARDNFVKMRQNKPGIAPEDTATKVRRYVGLSIIALLAAVALFFVMGNIFQSAFVLKTSEARVAIEQTSVETTPAPVIEALFSMQDIQKISIGDKAVIAIGGSDVVIDAEVASVGTKDMPAVTGANNLFIGRVTLKTKQPLPAEIVGRPVSVAIRM